MAEHVSVAATTAIVGRGGNRCRWPWATAVDRVGRASTGLVSAGVIGAARDRLAELLGGVEGQAASSARSTLPVDSLRVEVRGVGALGIPVSQAHARQLCAIARPARYGRGEDTLLDRRVRDTWEVPKSRVKIDKRRWHGALRPVLDRFRRELGLRDGCGLTVELHSMLVYGPGQFFVAHQDTEKDDAMVGSLVVTLPSSFTGGDLVVHGGTGTERFKSSKTALSLVAFYADCRHEIQRVRSGYRIVLTYNLLLRGEPTTAVGAEVDAAVEGVASCLDEHFTTPIERRWRTTDLSENPPSRLVYLLDHEYTRRGMGWSRLKAGDATRAAVLRAAAEEAGCEVVLALADVHETWSAFEPDHDSWGRGSGRRRWDDHEPEEEDEDDWFGENTSFDAAGASDFDKYELDELIESEVTLDSWTEPEGGPARPVASTVDHSEVCASASTGDLVPYAAEYEGYMGNYGNTLDRWYHRGALVVWPRRLAFTVRAAASPTWAVEELARLLGDGQEDAAREHAASLAPIWKDAVHGTAPEPTFVGTALHAAGTLADADLAAVLVAPFPLSAIEPEHAEPLVRLGDTYGTGWTRDLVDRWSAAARFDRTADHLAWTASLPRLCDPLAAAGPVGLSIARTLARRSGRTLLRSFEQRRSLTPPSRAQDALLGLAEPVLGVLEAAGRTGDTGLRDEVTVFLTADTDGTDDLLACTMAILRDPPRADRTAAGLDQLAQHCRRRLEARTGRPPRAHDDWSVCLPSGCDCDLCQTLGEFLAHPTRQVIEWPIAQAKRQHVHRRIDDAELPVRHQTRRRGSPYTLVLTKSDELFTREQAARRQDEADLIWLITSGMAG
jgi:2OG-Fe(II) oxygenase superfamily